MAEEEEEAAGRGAGSGARRCGNCKKDIPVANFTIHEIHCSRNIGVCHFCQESIPKSELKNHVELEHTEVTCKCSMKMERGDLLDHMASACPLRLIACPHCELQLAFNKLQDHMDYCGARTERCSRCNRNVMLKDLKEHPEDCGRKAEEGRISQPRPCLNSEAALRNVQMIRNILHSDGSSGPLPRMKRLPESRLYNCLSSQQLPRNLPRRNVDPLQPEENPDRLEKTVNTSAFVDGESDCHLDYLLALSLQHDDSPHDRSAPELQKESWKNICPTRTRATGNFPEANDFNIFSQDLWGSTNPSNKAKVETMLPCEFCEELYPEEDLILHQTGCSPASALASFSKRSASFPWQDQAEHLTDLWEQLQRNQSHSRETSPLQPDSRGSIMIPCEFCGVQLEDEILFHHQDQCDLRPATACSTGRSPSQSDAPATKDLERTESPDVPRRHVRHQGEISPQGLQEFRQQRPPQPVQRSRSRGHPAAARHLQLNSPSTRRETAIGPSERGKVKEQGGAGKGEKVQRWGPSDTIREPLPVRGSPHKLPSSSYVPSFPVTVPTRPRLRSEGGTSPLSPPHYSSSNSQAKPWPTESAYPDKEE